MHFIAIRRDVYEKNRWIAMQLLKAFEEAKNRSLARAGDLTASYFPVPLLSYAVQDARAVAGEDFWPYGIEENRVTLEAFLRFAHEQGVSQRKVEIEELFVPEISALRTLGLPGGRREKGQRHRHSSASTTARFPLPLPARPFRIRAQLPGVEPGASTGPLPLHLAPRSPARSAHRYPAPCRPAC